jgi:hypothetical protein
MSHWQLVLKALFRVYPPALHSCQAKCLNILKRCCIVLIFGCESISNETYHLIKGYFNSLRFHITFMPYKSWIGHSAKEQKIGEQILHSIDVRQRHIVASHWSAWLICMASSDNISWITVLGPINLFQVESNRRRRHYQRELRLDFYYNPFVGGLSGVCAAYLIEYKNIH